MQVTSHLLIYSGSFPLLLLQVNDEDLASLLSLGYDEKMARRALRWSFSIDFLTIEDMCSICRDLQGGFFNWSALKMTKCQTLRKF